MPQNRDPSLADLVTPITDEISRHLTLPPLLRNRSRAQRARVPADEPADDNQAAGPRPYSGSSRPATADKPGLSPAISRASLKVRTG
jgi:hypothetical protein